MALPTMQVMRQGIVRILRSTKIMPAINILKKHSYAAAAIAAATTLLAIPKTRHSILFHLQPAKIGRSLKRMVRRAALGLWYNSKAALGFNPNPYDGVHKTPLFRAVEKDDYDLAEILIGAGVNIACPTMHNTYPIHIATQHNNIHMVRLLVERGGAGNTCENIHGCGPLHMAAQNGNREILNIFLAIPGITINSIESRHQMTALHLAVQHNHPDIVRDLVAVDGVRLNSYDDAGNTPLHLAVSLHLPEMVGILIGAGALINRFDQVHRVTPLHVAAERGYTDILENLLDHGADINCLDNLDRTPLHIAAEFNKPDVMRALIRRGADKYAEDALGRHFFEIVVPQREIRDIARAVFAH
jgi:ankyrin repeat protein